MVALSNESLITQSVNNAVTQVVVELMTNKYGNIYKEGKLNPVYASEFEAMYYQISTFIFKTIK